MNMKGIKERMRNEINGIEWMWVTTNKERIRENDYYERKKGNSNKKGNEKVITRI